MRRPAGPPDSKTPYRPAGPPDPNTPYRPAGPPDPNTPYRPAGPPDFNTRPKKSRKINCWSGPVIGGGGEGEGAGGRRGASWGKVFVRIMLYFGAETPTK